MADGEDGTYVEHTSPESFAMTLDRIVTAIGHAGMTVFAQIDHAASARDVGLTMPPTIVLIYGNPRGGTPVMQAAPRMALDLPLRILVREDADGRVRVGFHPMSATLKAAGVPDALAERLDAAQQAILGEIKP